MSEVATDAKNGGKDDSKGLTVTYGIRVRRVLDGLGGIYPQKGLSRNLIGVIQEFLVLSILGMKIIKFVYF